MIRLTAGGWLALLGCFGLYLASLTSQSALLLFPIGLLLGCMLVNAARAFRTVRAIEVLSAESLRLVEGEKTHEYWTLKNRVRRAVGWCAIRHNSQRWLRAGALAAGEQKALPLEVTFAKRGIYNASGLRLCSSFPFGLVEARRPLAWEGQVIVHPRMYETSAPRPTGFEHVLGGKLKGTRQSSTGFEFAGVRGFREGDSWRDIHWKSSSKGSGWMVKLYEEELGGRIGLIVGGGARASAERVDAAVRAAASLIWAALEAGHEVAWVDWAMPELRRVTPFSDGSDFLDQLARLKPIANGNPEIQLAQALERFQRRPALSLVLTEWTRGMERVLNESSWRRWSVYLPEDLEKADLAARPADCHWFSADRTRTSIGP